MLVWSEIFYFAHSNIRQFFDITKYLYKKSDMKVKDEIISKLRLSQRAKNRIMYELSISSATLYRFLKENAMDSDLTKARVVRLIAEELGLPEDSILEEERNDKKK